MGQALLRLLPSYASASLVAAFSRGGGGDVLPATRLDDAPPFDVAIDFSLPAALEPVVSLCERRGAALVCGTTGLSAAQQQRLDLAGSRVPLLWAANFSLGVAVLSDLARRAASLLPQWDCDLVEAHHRHKRDAPSGTALALGTEVEQARGGAPVYHSLRAGDIVGEHALQFTAQGERLELVHRATDRDIFARGALHCALRLAGRAPGRYRIAQLLLDGG